MRYHSVESEKSLVGDGKHRESRQASSPMQKANEGGEQI